MTCETRVAFYVVALAVSMHEFQFDGVCLPGRSS